jgi:DNA-binding transcriptional LysR family regulator
MEAMLPNLDVDHLKTFLAISDGGSFTKAAEEVNKTQSAVSMQMKRLEDSLGRALFERDGRSNRLTLDGERFIEHARKLVAMNDEIVSSYARPEITGSVRFGTPDDYADLFLPEVLGRFHRTHPLVTVDVECVSSTNLMERIRRAEIDVALVTFCGKCDPGEGEVLRREELRWVSSSRHATHALPVIPLAVADLTCEWRKLAADAIARTGRAHRIAYTSHNRTIIDAAVLQGLAVAAMPDICIRPGMRVLTEAEGFPSLGSFEIGLVRKPGRHTQAADALAQHIRESFGKSDMKVAAE